MLYYLYEIYHFNLFQYITVRAGFAFFIAFALTLFCLPKFIRWAQSKNTFQPIYSLAPQHHQKKSTTPTMGGMVFTLATLGASFFTTKLHNHYVIAAFLLIFGFLLIGFLDDWGKVVKKSNQSGLSAKAKFSLQNAPP